MMGSGKIIILIVGMFYLMSCHVLTQERYVDGYDKDLQPLITGDIAVKKALEYTGFEKMKGFSIKDNLDVSEIVIIHNDNTPFLHEKINERKCWKVVMKDIYLHFYKSRDTTDTIPRLIETYIDAENGQLYKIEMKHDDSVCSLNPEPAHETAEQTLRNHNEIYHDFVNTEVNISFYEAMGMGGPAILAGKISAILVEHSYFRSENDISPAWVITYFGIPPSEAEKVEIKGRYHLRTVVNANSNELILVTTNIP